MITRPKNLDSQRYYYCISQSRESHAWLSKGNNAVIYQGCKAQPDATPYYGGGTLQSDIDWLVRDANSEEIEWIINSMAIGRVTPKPVSLQYQIF